jgi:hypothetical protein
MRFGQSSFDFACFGEHRFDRNQISVCKHPFYSATDLLRELCRRSFKGTAVGTASSFSKTNRKFGLEIACVIPDALRMDEKGFNKTS